MSRTRSATSSELSADAGGVHPGSGDISLLVVQAQGGLHLKQSLPFLSFRTPNGHKQRDAVISLIGKHL